MEEIKIVHSNIMGIEANLEIEINGLTFQAYWKPDNMGEVCCLTQPNGITETELKSLISAFKEAKSKLIEKMESLNQLILPIIDVLK